jgi:tetratricopeptide (TPR) repeat protein
VGLRAFSDSDGKYFFGRDREVNEIIERLKHHNFLALIGDSGSGKSSIVKAKVIPYYLKSDSFVLQMRPANNPYLELSNQLKEVVRPEDKELVLRMLHAFCQEKKTTLLFYIDQFEELFTSTSKENRESFLALLLYLHENQSSQLKIEIVFTMRSDYYPLLKQYKSFISLIEQKREENRYVIQRMGNEELKETIYKPLLSVNLVNEDEAKTFAEFVVQSMGIKSNEITLLQIAMTQTWRFLEEGKGLFDAYDKADGVSGALQKLAKETIEAVGEEELLKTIFIRLIHFDRDGNHTRRVVSKSEFRANQWKLVQRLSSALNEQGEVAKGEAEKLGRLLKLSKSDKDEEQSVELVHEALILGWKDYAEWIGEFSLFKLTHDIVIEKSREYYAKKRGRSFLLMGADLAKASHLLDNEYQAFLSDDERKYIQKSLGYNALIKNGIIFGLLLLLGTVGYFWYEAEKSKEEIIQVLQRSTDGASIVIQGNRLSNVRLITQPIVEQFKASKSVEIQRIVSQAWFVNARSFQRMKREKKALNQYRELVTYFKNNTDKDVIRYVVQSLFNQGLILGKSGQKKEAIACFDRGIDRFRSSKNLKKIEMVLWAWHKKISLLEDREKQERAFLALIAYSKDITNTNKKIDKLITIAYGNLLEVLIFNHKYEEGLKIGKEGALRSPVSVGLEINLAHLYLLSNQVDRAKEIYLRYKKEKKSIQNDFEKFKAEGIKSKEFSKILELLSN